MAVDDAGDVVIGHDKMAIPTHVNLASYPIEHISINIAKTSSNEATENSNKVGI